MIVDLMECIQKPKFSLLVDGCKENAKIKNNSLRSQVFNTPVSKYQGLKFHTESKATTPKHFSKSFDFNSVPSRKINQNWRKESIDLIKRTEVYFDLNVKDSW